MHISDIDITEITEASERLRGVVVATPLLSSARANDVLGGEVYIKPECLQHTGSFKFRGASNALALLDGGDGGGVGCVVAWSSGNHGQAVAAAASRRGLRAVIVMPEDAPRAKIDGVRAWGGEVVFYNRQTESREEIGEALAAELGAAVIPPFDYPPVIAGQGSLGVEIVNDCKELGFIPDQLVCCTGGGGLLAGVSISLKYHFPDTAIIAAEPHGFDDFRRSLVLGERVANSDATATTLCDAIMTPMPGALTFPINQRLVSAGVAVNDEAVLNAMAFIWKHYRLVAEPGGAVALAAALEGRVNRGKATSKNKTAMAAGLTGEVSLKDRKTVIIISGGNVDAEIFAQALERVD